MSVIAATDRITPLPLGKDRLHNDFRTHVEGGWRNVHPDNRARMDRLLTSPDDTVFEGTGCVRRSPIGWIFAQLSRLFGAPLVRARGENVGIRVRVAPTANGLRCWHREFVFADGTRQLVQTTKIVHPKYGILDAVGAEGERLLATKMQVWTRGKSLCFRSDAYLMRFRYFTIRVPEILTPGQLFAEHRDEGNGVFRYILAFRHPLWGETFYQEGLFKMVE